MPQLIAMIIVVVGAMIYMFQTFGGTGDKIEGIAQKTSIITEINNVKNGLKLAARDGVIIPSGTAAATAARARNLEGLGELNYFAQQINEQLDQDPDAFADAVNDYNTISFGGTQDNAGSMTIQLINDRVGRIPGILVTLRGNLADNAGFLEAQIAADLAAVAYVDRLETDRTTEDDTLGDNGIDSRIPAAAEGGTETDGIFAVYFRDFGSAEVVVAAP